jgi:putative PEP-CTERM system histidine kinase
MIHWIEGAAFICGLGLSALISIYPRFGPGSRRLLLFLLPASFSAGVQAYSAIFGGLSLEDSLRLSFTLINLVAAGGYVTSLTIEQQDSQILKTRRLPVIGACTLAVLCSALQYILIPPYAQGLQASEGYIALGLAGYISSLFMLIISVFSLANLEQILRSASETVRWELKFLFLGMAAIFGAIIYVSSHVLLFSAGIGLLSIDSIKLLNALFLISCGLIAISWKRGSGRVQVAVSHGLIYSSITLLSVGIYLITSSVIARWVGRYVNIGLPMEAFIFLLSAIAMAIVLLGTAFRHRARAWVRRNIFAGRYDYRQFWLEATERIRSIDPPDLTASALADIVHKAVGAIDVSIWIRRWNPNRLHLISCMGTVPDAVEKEGAGVVEQLLSTTEPLSPDNVASQPEMTAVKSFMNSTHTSLLVPLLSSNRIVGIIAVGSDRSGRSYDWEAREFLRVLAGHAAGEFHKSDLLATLVEAKEDEAFRSFSTFVLHDLKNFASTLSYIAQNAPQHQHNPEFQKDALHSVYETAEKMKRLCNSLRMFSSNLAPNQKPADLNQIVRSVIDSLNAGFRDHLKLELGNLPPVLADSEELSRVLQNLMLNAREAISEDGVIIVRTVHQGETIELEIVDNGKGMNPEFMKKELFLPFHTTKSDGLGIGLFQSKKIVEAHKGSIQVESEMGKGTTVRLIFPAL